MGISNLDGALLWATGIDNSGIEKDADQTKRIINNLSDSVERDSKKMESSLGSVSKLIGTIGGALFLEQMGKEILDTTAKFEKFGIVLKNTLGEIEGQKALDMITDFTATTPFQLDEVTGAFIKMANQGFVPNQEQMIKLGDLASSTGKSFDQLAEAILDAQTGEFERLKEFGIKASQSGDAVTFSFKEQKTTIEKSNSAIRDYILSLGTLEGVFGANDKISAGLTGKISNLEDQFSMMFNEIGTANKGVMSDAIDITSSLVGNYETVGKVIMGLVATYGAYKAAVIVSNTVSSLQAKIAYQQMLANIGNTGATIKLTTAQGLQAIAASALSKVQLTLNKTLLANPYIAAATAVVALTSVVLGLVSAKDKETQADKSLEKVRSSAMDQYDDQKAKIDSLIGVMRNEKTSLEDRRNAISQIQQIVPSYHASLTNEGTLINDNKTAIDEYLKSLEKTTKFQAAQVELIELYKTKRQQEKDVKSKQTNLDTVKAQNKIPDVVSGGDAGIAGAAAMADNISKANEKLVEAKNNLANTQAAIDAINKEIEDGSKKNSSSGNAPTVENKAYWEKIKKQAQEALDVLDQSKKGSKEWNNLVNTINNANKKLEAWDTKGKTGNAKDVYNAEKEIQDLVIDLRQQTASIVIEQERDSLQKRLGQINLDKEKEIQAVKEKELAIVEAYNKSHKKDKGFTLLSTKPEDVRASLKAISPEAASSLEGAIAGIIKAYGEKTKAETIKWNKEILDLATSFADERVQIEHDYKDDIEKLEKDGNVQGAANARNERNKKISEATVGLIQETNIFKTATDEKLDISKKMTDTLISDIQARIKAEMLAGRLSVDDAKKLLNELKDAQDQVAENKERNNPFSMLKSAVGKSRSAKLAVDNFSGIGKNPNDAKAELANLQSEAKKADLAIAASAGQALQGVKTILSSVVNGMDELGLLTEEQKQTANEVIGMVGGAADIAMGIATGNPMQIIQGSIDLIVNAYKLFDTKTKEIEKHQKEMKDSLEELTRSYEKLQRAVDKSLGTDVFENQRKQIENLQQTIKNYYTSIQLEYEKGKKRDKEKIQDWRDKINDAKNQIEDITQSITENLAQTNAKDLASELSDAMVSAFQNGEDAAISMGKVTDNVIRNAVVNALKLKYLEKPMQDAVDFLGNALADGILSDEEKAKFEKMVTEPANDFNNGLKLFEDIFGKSSALGGVTGELKQQMTEQTGSQLVGLWNMTAMDIRWIREWIALNASGGLQASSNEYNLDKFFSQVLDNTYSIEQNTKRTADNTDGLVDAIIRMVNQLNEISKNTKTSTSRR